MWSAVVVVEGGERSGFVGVVVVVEVVVEIVVVIVVMVEEWLKLHG